MADNNQPLEFDSQSYLNEVQYYFRKFSIQVVTIWLGLLALVLIFSVLGLFPFLGEGFQILIAVFFIGFLLAVPMRVIITFWRTTRYLWRTHKPPYVDCSVQFYLKHDKKIHEKQFDTVRDRAFWVGKKLFFYGFYWFLLFGLIGGVSSKYIETLVNNTYQQYPDFIQGVLKLITDIIGIRIFEVLQQFGDPKTVAGLSFIFIPMAYLEMLALMNYLFGIEEKWVSKTQQNSNIRETKWYQEILSIGKLLVVAIIVSILLMFVITLIPR